jgi:hypothetical protein
MTAEYPRATLSARLSTYSKSQIATETRMSCWRGTVDGSSDSSIHANTELQTITHALGLCKEAILGTMGEIITGTGQTFGNKCVVPQGCEKASIIEHLHVSTHTAACRDTYSKQTLRLLVPILTHKRRNKYGCVRLAGLAAQVWLEPGKTLLKHMSNHRYHQLRPENVVTCVSW